MARHTSIGRVLFVATIGILAASSLQAASPRLTNITPRGIQRGQEHVVSFTGSSLADAQEILFYTPGFEVVSVEPAANAVKATVKVAADCVLGEHVAQVRTASGLSDFRSFYVEDLPAVDEKEPNSDFATPQPIEMNVVVNGTVANEDVDYYVVQAKKGQRISAEVVAMRLGTALFDPYVAILDAKRFELSANDDTALALQDAFASVVAPEDGAYTIEVRESAYGAGNVYRLHVGTFPRPATVYPAGGKAGEPTDVRFLGDPAGELTQSIVVPAKLDDNFGVFATDAGGISPTPNAFRIFEHGNAFEVEPNNALAEATPVELPLAFNGVIEAEGDADFFKFTATKGQVFEVECYARRVRSPLDPVMNLYRADGGSIAGNDDSRGPDSYFRFSVPADGEYVVRVTDHLGRGGPDFVYRIEFQAVKPSLTLSIPRVERYGQYRQQIYVARGNRSGTLINAARANFGGELILDGNDLPAGITMHAEPMAANLSSMPVVFEAAADAPIGGKLIDFTARHADPNQNIRGGFVNSADLIVGQPGQSIYKALTVDRLAIAVVDELPFTLEIVEPKVPLVREGVLQLKILAHRKEGFTAPISVQLPFRPPGLGATSAVNIPENGTEVLYELNANGSAQIGKWKLFALGSANIDGAAWVSSQLANLEIADKYVNFAMQRAACEQGQVAQVLCTVNHTTPFEGMATAKLLGLPPNTETTDIEFDKDTKEVIFSIKTTPESRVGKHNLICQLTVTQNGEPIVCTGGTVQLQIDQPLPAPTTPAPMPMPTPAAQPMPAAVAAQPEPPKAKPLTRLEKLRLEAKKRAEERAAQAAGG
jgi:hypothetical protein